MRTIYFTGKAGALRRLYDDTYRYMQNYKVDDQTALAHTWLSQPEFKHICGFFWFVFFDSIDLVHCSLIGSTSPDVLTLDYDMKIFGVLPPWFDKFSDVFRVHTESNIKRIVTRNGVEPSVLHFAGMRLQYLEKVITSLANQTLKPAKIYLNIPHWSKRFKEEYILPDFIKESNVVTVNWCKDYGPATKLIPTLDLEKEPSTRIITVDDDMSYERRTFEALMYHSLNPIGEAAYQFSGQNIDEYPKLATARGSVLHYSTHETFVRSADIGPTYNRKAEAVDILEAFRAVIYKRSFFNADALRRIPKECSTTDDIWISAHLAKQRIPRIKLPYMEECMAIPTVADEVTEE
eukprot:jgi/Bigna1/142372/aug1.69_g17080